METSKLRNDTLRNVVAACCAISVLSGWSHTGAPRRRPTLILHIITIFWQATCHRPVNTASGFLIFPLDSNRHPAIAATWSDGFVAGPADPCARVVLRDERLLQGVRRHVAKRGSGYPKREQKRRHALRLPEAASREIVLPTKGDDATLADVTMEFECPEGQLTHARNEHCFVGRANQIGLVAQALWMFQRRLRRIRAGEKIELCGHGRGAVGNEWKRAASGSWVTAG